MIYSEDREDRTRWCPRCGAEYRDEFTECADCGVPLTRERPSQSRSHQRNADTDDDAVAYDLEGWTVEQRTLLEFILNGDRIAYLFDDNLLVVPHAYQAKVEEIIDSIEGEPIDDQRPST